jgi:thiamine kinase-like enzyme
MDDQGIGLAREALKGIQLFWCLDDTEIEVRRLGGLTNLVFFVNLHGEQYVLRIPGKGTEEYINRKNEAQAAREAAKAKVSPDVLHFDEKTGIMVTRFIDQGVTMSPENFKSRDGSPRRAGEAFKKLHSSRAKFNFRFELFAMIDDYLKILATKDISLPDGYAEVVKEAESVRRALAAHKLPLAACHCDPLCENFLDTGKRMWIVDWEYSGMNDPLWDLGDLAVEGQFDTAQEEEMIAAYFEGEPTPSERGRFVIYKAMCDLLWTLWGLIQYANKNPADDFWAYSINRFERCKALMATPEFPVHVKAVADGRKK